MSVFLTEFLYSKELFYSVYQHMSSKQCAETRCPEDIVYLLISIQYYLIQSRCNWIIKYKHYIEHNVLFWEMECNQYSNNDKSSQFRKTDRPDSIYLKKFSTTMTTSASAGASETAATTKTQLSLRIVHTFPAFSIRLNLNFLDHI